MGLGREDKVPYNMAWLSSSTKHMLVTNHLDSCCCFDLSSIFLVGLTAEMGMEERSEENIGY